MACSSSGSSTGTTTTFHFASISSLRKVGDVDAARAAQPDALLMIHTDLGNKLNETWGAGYVSTWYSQLVAGLGAGGTAAFDAIGLSFYPHWGAGHTSNIARLGVVHDAFPDKQILLAECSWPYQGAASPYDEFPVSPDGQLAFAKAVAAQMRALPGGAGFAWWGAEYYSQTSGAGWTSLWDERGVALPALSAWA